MRVSAIERYDYVPKSNNYPQPCPAPVPYASNPNFGHSSGVVTTLKRLGEKILTFVAVVGWLIPIAFRGNNGQAQIEKVEFADDARYQFNFNGERRSNVIINDLEGFHIENEGISNNDNVLRTNREQYDIIRHLAAVAGDPEELSPEDIEQVTTENLGMPNYRVSRGPRDRKKPNVTEAMIEHIDENGNTISYMTAWAKNHPTAIPN